MFLLPTEESDPKIKTIEELAYFGWVFQLNHGFSFFLLGKSCVWNESRYKNGQSVLLVLLRYQEDTYQLFGVNDKTCNHVHFWNLNLKLFTNSLQRCFQKYIEVGFNSLYNFLYYLLLISSYNFCINFIINIPEVH